MNILADTLLEARAQLGEGAFWDAAARKLLWVDILGRKVHIFDPASGEDEAHDVGETVGAVVPRASGGLMLAVASGFAAFEPVTGRLEHLVDPEAGRDGNRFNDGKCDPSGRFWAGTMSLAGAEGQGALYRLDPDLSAHKMRDGVSISNGIVWTGDRRTMYYIDTPLKSVTAFDYDDATGAIDNERVVIRVPQGWGYPDGMAIDADDKLWIAHWEGGCVRRWDPATGNVLGTVYVPTPRVTACAFGGDKLDTLYITTAQGSDIPGADSRRGGDLFVARPAVVGAPMPAFAG